MSEVVVIAYLDFSPVAWWTMVDFIATIPQGIPIEMDCLETVEVEDFEAFIEEMQCLSLVSVSS